MNEKQVYLMQGVQDSYSSARFLHTRPIFSKFDFWEYATSQGRLDRQSGVLLSRQKSEGVFFEKERAR